EEHAAYANVRELKRQVEAGNFNSILAVLPEGSRLPHTPDSTHESIKREIQLPSQCIQYDQTLHQKWVGRSHRDLKDLEPHHARRVQQKYEVCLLNLLVKLAWVPFAPALPFHYNTHIGLDVGGKHNNRIMSCIGHGFGAP